MAITHGTSTHADLVRGVSVSKVVAVPAGTNLAMLIGISWVNEIAEDEYVSSVTVQGVSATFIQLRQSPAGTVEQYYTTALTGGSNHSVVVGWAGTAPDVTAVVGIEVMEGVDPTSPIGAINTASATSAAPSVALTTTDTTGFVVDSIYVQSNLPAGVTVGPGQTERWGSPNIGDPPTQVDGYGSSETSGATGTTMSWTLLGGSRAWALAATEFRPFVAPIVTPGDVNVLTSYDYLEVSPDKLDRADRLPEEAAKAWIGRWRH